MPETEQIPLFPLRVVMFPGGRLDLQIFERRYIDLVSHCMRTSTGFGVCLLKEGEEVIQEGEEAGLCVVFSSSKRILGASKQVPVP